MIFCCFQTLEGQHGSALALGCMISQMLYPDQTNDVIVQDMETDQSENGLSDHDVIRDAVKKIGKGLIVQSY